MESTNPNEMFDKIANQLFAESKRLNELRSAGEEVTTEGVEPIALEEYREAFIDMPPEFLSNEHLEQELKRLKDNLYKLKQFYPEGSNIQLATFPCTDVGLPYSDEMIKERRYLIPMFINEKTGLSTGYGNMNPSTHAKLLPKEIQENCSFTVHYEADYQEADEKDFEQFAVQYTKAFKELQRMLKQ
jgi:hypothetical protein